jgi:hypothetical protein
MGVMFMPGVTKEQIAKAKEIDLLTYLQRHEPQAIRQKGRADEYYLAEHDSLKISNGRWHWFSKGIGGKTALDFLVHVRGVTFVDAVLTLTGDSRAPLPLPQPVIPVSSQTQSNRDRASFVAPPVNRCGTKAVEYLCRRGIDSEIIEQCLKERRIYESGYKGEPVCVFTGTDKNGELRYASIRAVNGDMKREVFGSDKRHGFCLPSCAPSSRFVAVTESPIDALSLATLRKMETNAWDRYNYLSLGGTSPLALMQYLKDHPEADHVYLYLDNDRAGRDGAAAIKKAIYADAELGKRIAVITAETPENHKDWNEQLVEEKAKMPEAIVKRQRNKESVL